MVSMEKNSYKSVRFNTNVRLRKFVKAPIELKSELWYGAADLREMKQSDALIVKALNDPNFSESDLDEDVCTRGLESRTKTGLAKKVQSRYVAREAVFDEQERQWKTSEEPVDDEIISKVYRAYTARALIEAQRLGRSDAKTVHMKHQHQQQQSKKSPSLLHQASKLGRKVSKSKPDFSKAPLAWISSTPSPAANDPMPVRVMGAAA